MINQKKILQTDIRHACGDTYYGRGKRYFEQDHILGLKIVKEGDDFVELRSSVQGSGHRYYEQYTRIDWKDAFTTVIIDGECSCPMAFNCKHIAAICLGYMHANLMMNGNDSTEPQCFQWLENFDDEPESIDPQNEFITYVLIPAKTPHIYTLKLVITKFNKSGGLNKGRATTINNLRYSGSYINYIQPVDQEIAKLLSTLDFDYNGEVQLFDQVGALALSRVLQTGRLFYKTHQSSPLQPGEDRDLCFSWEQHKNGDFVLQHHIEPDAKLVLMAPPFFIDEQQGVIGRINALPVSYSQLKKILTMPPVPEKYAQDFSERLIIDVPTAQLPAPKSVVVNEVVDASPVVKITLFGAQLANNQYSHFIRLNFLYDHIELSAYSPSQVSFCKEDNAIYRIQRNLEEEYAALQQLIDLGFAMTDLIAEKQLILLSPAIDSSYQSATRWSAFLLEVVPLLIDQGWIVEEEDSFKLNFNTAKDWEADIESSGNDWFEMRFQINIAGRSMPLLPLVMPVLSEYDLEELPEELSIPLGDHQYVNIQAKQLKPFLKIVYELFDTASTNEQGHLMVSRFNAASVAELDQHHYGLFSLKGGKELIETGKKLQNFSGIENVMVPKGLNASLRGYQQEGLNWLQFLREYNFAGILADDMGLGKTIQTLTHLLFEKEAGRLTKPCLVIAPTSLMSNWRREAERFTSDLRVLVLQGTERKSLFEKINEVDLVLTTYPLLPRDQDVLKAHQYHYLILDEAQMIKNPNSQAAKIVRGIDAQYRLCLTGTPMENHLGELWAQFDFLMPGFLGDSATFKKVYRTPIETHGDQQQKERLAKRLKPFMLRRTKQQVATELPQKTEMVRSITLSEEQAALYETIRISMEKKVRDAIADKGLARSHITILDALLKLRQTCCDPRILALKEVQKVTQSAKLDLLLELLPELLEEGRRILVFSQFTKMIGVIEKSLKAEKIEYAKLTGQTKKRDDAIERFKQGDANVFLISLKAGGVGLNLTEADTVIIYDPWWNPAVETQAADRAYRIGQDKPVFVYKLITENTVEEKILAMQEKKKDLAESMYKGNKSEQSIQLTSHDLTELFQPLT